MKFELNEDYAKMIGGCVLPGVLVAGFFLVLTLLFFMFKFATWLLLGGDWGVRMLLEIENSHFIGKDVR